MDNKLLLAKSVTLLYRESQLIDKSENSSELVRTVLENVQVSEIGLGMSSDRDIIIALKNTIIEMCDSPQDHDYDKTDLLQRIRINCGNDEKLYEAIKQGIEDEMSDGGLKRSILNIRKSIVNHFREQKISETLKKASHQFNFKREVIKDINQFLAETIAQLESLHINGSGKDSAVISDVDIGDEQSVRDTITEVQKLNSGDRIYRLGWQDLNDAGQGGIRPGETVVIGALQHKYKTGFSLSLFAQIAQFNKPLTQDPNKKPLLLRISFEDEVTQNLQFLYQYLKYDETLESVNIGEATADEVTTYVKSKLSATGFHVKIMRVDPSQWTYRSVCNKVIELEAQGYSVEVLMLDYLAKLPTTGCADNGALGNDMMDMLSRMRNFCSARGTAFITPHQFSTEAKALLRGGLSEDQFVKEVADKGYWEKTRGLDRIYDLAFLIHLFKFNKETYFSVFREKHRIPSIIDDEKRYMLFKFPKGMPIPSDLNRDKISFRKLGAAPSNASEELFKLG